jgi:hypothetical protein
MLDTPISNIVSRFQSSNVAADHGSTSTAAELCLP